VRVANVASPNVLNQRAKQAMIAQHGVDLLNRRWNPYPSEFVANPLHTSMAMAVLLSSLQQADFAADRMRSAAQYLEARLLAVAEQLPYILPDTSTAAQRTEAGGLARELRTARRPGDYT
jgi:hypothetical protein